MNNPQTKIELIEQLQQVQRGVTETVQAMSAQQFETSTGEAWAASGYLKHLILSVKPFAKALNLPVAQLQRMFGQADGPSRTYHEVVAVYKARLDEGIRAEDFDRVTPTFYRMPEGIEDEQAYLVETWNESNERLMNVLQHWDEDALDRYQLPHPAIGTITIREMLFFTLYHNTMHWRDIEEAGRNAVT
jgi:hypothetical protein